MGKRIRIALLSLKRILLAVIRTLTRFTAALLITVISGVVGWNWRPRADINPSPPPTVLVSVLASAPATELTQFQVSISGTQLQVFGELAPHSSAVTLTITVNSPDPEPLSCSTPSAVCTDVVRLTLPKSKVPQSLGDPTLTAQVAPGQTTSGALVAVAAPSINADTTYLSRAPSYASSDTTTPIADTSLPLGLKTTAVFYRVRVDKEFSQAVFTRPPGAAANDTMQLVAGDVGLLTVAHSNADWSNVYAANAIATATGAQASEAKRVFYAGVALGLFGAGALAALLEFVDLWQKLIAAFKKGKASAAVKPRRRTARWHDRRHKATHRA